jgi:hypothetical protein
MVNFTTTLARANGAAPSTNHEVGQTEAAAAITPSSLPPPTANRVDMMYRQLAEIHFIVDVQLEECARWVNLTQLLAR